MKKSLSVVITLFLMIGIVATCVCWYTIATKDAKSSDSENSNTEVKNEPIFTLENYPKVDASLAIHPLVDSIAADFLGIPESELNFKYTKTRTSDVYQNLIDGTVDVIFVAEASQEDLEYAQSKGVELEIIPATSSAFVFIVNTKNPVKELTLDEVIQIYQGKITNWKEVGGEDAEIIPYQRPNGSGSQTAMLSLVMKDETLMSAPKMQIQLEMGELIDAVAEYDNAANAIGYTYYYYVNTMYRKDTIQILGINGIQPTIETIQDGSYPLYTNGYIVFRKDEPENSSVRKWVDYVLSERGRKVIEAAGYVPLKAD